MSNLVLHPCSVLTPDDPNSSYGAAIHEDPNNAAIAVVDSAGNPLTAGGAYLPCPRFASFRSSSAKTCLSTSSPIW